MLIWMDLYPYIHGLYICIVAMHAWSKIGPQQAFKGVSKSLGNWHCVQGNLRGWQIGVNLYGQGYTMIFITSDK